MSLFKSKEEKESEVIEKLSKPYIEKGFVISKQVLIQGASLFLIDTQNKKWAYTNLAKEKNNIVKIYDFKDLNRYEANNDSKAGNHQSTTVWGYGLASTSSNKRYCYSIKAFLNTNDIDDSIIEIMNISFDSDSLMARNITKYQDLYTQITKCLEYILNNK